MELIYRFAKSSHETKKIGGFLYELLEVDLACGLECRDEKATSLGELVAMSTTTVHRLPVPDSGGGAFGFGTRTWPSSWITSSDFQGSGTSLCF